MESTILYVYHPLDENEFDVEKYIQENIGDCKVYSFELESDSSNAMTALEKTCCELKPTVIVASGVAGVFAHQMSHYVRLIINPDDFSQFFDDEYMCAFDYIKQIQFRHVEAEKSHETHADYCNCWVYIANKEDWKFRYASYITNYYPNIQLYQAEIDNITKEVCDNIIIPFILFHVNKSESYDDGTAYTEYGRTLQPIDKDKFMYEEYRMEEGCITIEPEAFAGCQTLKSFYSANSIKRIGEGCFSDCINLEKLILPNDLKTIPANMCQGCTALKEIILPESCERIEDGAFLGTAIKLVEIPESIIYIAEDAFPKGCKFIVSRPMVNKAFHEISYMEMLDEENKDE